MVMRRLARMVIKTNILLRSFSQAEGMSLEFIVFGKFGWLRRRR
jgi:hypothetical protein